MSSQKLCRCALALAASASLSCASRATPRSARASPESGAEMVLVRGGCYAMGAHHEDCDATPEERPRHEVCVRDFYISRYEVTHAQWRDVMGSDTTEVSTCRDPGCPVDNVTFADVQEFLARLNARGGGRTFRLPTEAEWEYAARSGGKDELYAGSSSDLDAVAWYAGNSGKINHPVGGKAANGLGLHDMAGNVWEMTSDWYDARYYDVSPRDDPRGPAAGEDHVVRGGCRTGGAVNQRTARRTFINDRTKGAGRGGNVGFRLAASP